MAIAISVHNHPARGRRNGGYQERMRGSDWKAPGLEVPGLDVPSLEVPGLEVTVLAVTREPA